MQLYKAASNHDCQLCQHQHRDQSAAPPRLCNYTVFVFISHCKRQQPSTQTNSLHIDTYVRSNKKRCIAIVIGFINGRTAINQQCCYILVIILKKEQIPQLMSKKKCQSSRKKDSQKCTKSKSQRIAQYSPMLPYRAVFHHGDRMCQQQHHDRSTGR